jgi:hypothetical protein
VGQDANSWFFEEKTPTARSIEAIELIAVLYALGWIIKMTKCLPDEKRNCLLREETREVRLDCANFCVAGLMSRCSAGTVWNEQKRCKYAEKSTVSNRCMHFIEAIDGHCDCAEAQRELRNAVKIKAHKP